MIRVEEIYFNSKLLFQFFMSGKQKIIISGASFPFRKSFFNFSGRTMNTYNAHCVYRFKKRYSQFAINHNQNDSFTGFSRNNEIELHMTNFPSGIDVLGSSVDEGSAIEHTQSFPFL